MMRCIPFIFFLLSCAAARGQQKSLEAYWDDGLKFRSKDSLYKFSVGGRVHYDVAASGQSAALDSLHFMNNRMEIRRSRISFEGTLNAVLEYEFEFTFGEQLEYADMYLSFISLPFFEKLTIGHFREPFGMEEMTSANSIVFMERSLTSAFGPSRNAGIMVQKPFLQNKAKLYAGIFRITDDLGSDLEGRGNHSFSTRLVFLPAMKGEKKLLHLGLAYNRYAPDSATYVLKSSNEVNTAPNYIHTGPLYNVKTVQQGGLEVGYVNGPLFFAAEWAQSFFEQEGAHKTFPSAYAMVSYFFKGGERGYSRSKNQFSSVKLAGAPKQRSLRGAWEGGLRYAFLDIGNEGERLHRLHNVTAGLNWYFNSNSRIMANYVHSFFNDGLRAHTLQFRLQVVF